ncbi:SlyX family protein [Bacteroidales bacterium OttesenSCG-928-A17]|nr:SlyX family protein [Bacteroidales bacterium OttesenSCG-928-A17]
MKTKITFSVVFIIASFFALQVKAQQIGNGATTVIPNFNVPLLSGAYTTCNDQEGHPQGDCKYLFTIRNDALSVNRQWQFSTNFYENDRIFFRKIYADQLVDWTSPWYEIATRGSNFFVGDQFIAGKLSVGVFFPQAPLDVTENTPNSLKSVLARLGEGTSTGEGTYLGVKSYDTQPIDGNESDCDKVKSFSIEHKFFGELNSAINFYRGNSTTGGSIKIAVDNGTEICKFHSGGLDLAGTIRAKEVRIEAAGNWPDFVFSEEYNLPSLTEVKKHIDEKKHLPGIPSEEEVKENGINMGEMQAKLLQKIEELTLYVIEQQKTIDELSKEVRELKTKSE